MFAGTSPLLRTISLGVAITSFIFPLASFILTVLNPFVPRSALTPPAASPPVSVSATP